MEEYTAIKVSCLCGFSRTSLSVPNSSLPLIAVLCHCNTSRHVSGLLYTSYAPLPSAPDDLHGLTEYRSSNDLSRFFCSSCGAHMFGHQKSTDTWKVATGVLDKSEQLVQFDSQMWIRDTLDGGLSDWLPELYGSSMVRWKHGRQCSESLPPGRCTRPGNRHRGEWVEGQNLQAGCHCGGVQFYITPPNEESSKASSPWSDLLVPYHVTSSQNPDDVKWWLRVNGTKYLAGTCACKSCRLASGFDIQSWAFVPRANILQVTGKALEFGMGTLKRYESSAGTFREFCRVCGATVFWHCDERRPDLIDVSVGLLKAESGARAEEWLDWCTSKVSFEEQALNRELIQGLAKGLEAWGEGPVSGCHAAASVNRNDDSEASMINDHAC